MTDDQHQPARTSPIFGAPIADVSVSHGRLLLVRARVRRDSAGRPAAVLLYSLLPAQQGLDARAMFVGELEPEAVGELIHGLQLAGAKLAMARDYDARRGEQAGDGAPTRPAGAPGDDGGPR